MNQGTLYPLIGLICQSLLIITAIYSLIQTFSGNNLLQEFILSIGLFAVIQVIDNFENTYRISKKG